MASVEIGTETEAANQWQYEVTVRDGSHDYRHRVTLDWSDYDLWSHGRVAPQKVVTAAFEFLLEREAAASILPKFDCSLIRRYFPEVDRELPKLI